MNLRPRLALALLIAGFVSCAALVAACGSTDPTAGFHQTPGEGEDPGDLDGGYDAGN